MQSLTRRQAMRGAATLVVVMVLFFVMALVAAYANRNLIVEQRIGANYQDAVLANEVAERGVNTFINLLNAPNINETCQIAAAGANTARDRYLRFESTGEIRFRAPIDTDIIHCNQSGGSWNCQCPLNFTPVGVAAGSQRTTSARLQLNDGFGDGMLQLWAMGCVQSSANCKDTLSSSDADLGFYAQMKKRVRLQMVPALKSRPSSAAVATGSIDLGAGMVAVNDHAQTGGVALQAGGAVLGTRDKVQGPTGTPPAVALQANQTALQGIDAEGLFKRYFGMSPAQFQRQPVVETLKCPAQCATQLSLRAAAGVRVFWFEGDLTLDEDVTLGSVSRPILLVVKGKLSVQGGLRLHGMVFSFDNAQWLNASGSPSWLDGSLVVAGNLGSGSGVTMRHDAAAMESLMLSAGTFVRAPGGTWSEQ
ncbi:hypothetical protein HNQ51_001483 [Inhella inkyongensis]|uniref:Type 4 fimbrial biogenesis protein PilX N-terminal domain-containing protein n=1 Tax=Inhella inkyongensis TaxID=392593 RepID=A0A840S6U8_9BURK|nr:PilX N-terminal domain-containing pilus assembly protein [Inhella inkyongensis]MBB5204190.1 hypothetical protein [Inhella inkyongensis]